MPLPSARRAFTLIELLVVVAIIGLLVGILLPSLAAARAQARTAKCLSNLRVFGHGLAIYANGHRDVLPPGRLPKIDDCNAWADIQGGRKYRPTFVAMMSASVAAPPFDDPQACGNTIDLHGEPGGRQNYSFGVYVCPQAAERTDERNGAYGYNYQFLGNSRLLEAADLTSFKNWPVISSRVRDAARTVAGGDCMGTAASFPTGERLDYENNARDHERYGNEGFNLDPPRVDSAAGEMAGFDDSPQVRTAADPRHRRRAMMLWLDGHAAGSTLEQLGYVVRRDGVVEMDAPEADNTLWTGARTNEMWTPGWRP
ncbi:MAG: type II secretion system protein [Planctomycetota bacterium]|nr:MAG: type II secretion system protein [Planctomycetota bacterium]